MKIRRAISLFAGSLSILLGASAARALADSPATGQVLFAFDDQALPFQQGVRLRLISSRSAGEAGMGRRARPMAAVSFITALCWK
jgi:hypothetical protein